MKKSLPALLKRIEATDGAERSLDAAIEKALRGASVDAPDYTASVDSCLDLMHEILPDWHWHVGRGANGVMPYASMTRGEQTLTADGPTVPLVLLAVMVKALQLEP